MGRLPQVERKRRLAKLLADLLRDSPIHYSPHIEGRGEEVLNAMGVGGFEGVVAKWPDARYYSDGRSTAWLKVKCVRRQEFVVVGWTPLEYAADDVRALFCQTALKICTPKHKMTRVDVGSASAGNTARTSAYAPRAGKT